MYASRIKGEFQYLEHIILFRRDENCHAFTCVGEEGKH